MNLPTAPDQYRKEDQARFRDEVRREDARNYKRNVDLEIVRGQRLILTDEGTGLRYRVYIDAGALTVEAL